MSEVQPDKPVIAVIGLGYVGLPLAVEFGRRYPTIGFDISRERIAELEACQDSTLELSSEQIRAASELAVSSDPDAIGKAQVYIVTVPTPIDQYKRPDLNPLTNASTTVGRALSSGDTVVFESTVYPGATEEVCVPILETASGLRFNEGFYVGYSPERINPGDKEHGLTNIRKIVSGSTPATLDFVDDLYGSIIPAGTHRCSCIREAEAAKVIENTQRDLNIALINELAIIFDKLEIDTEAVLEAAGTKWNFLHFRPGLVGGHCIGVDPYYLTHKAQQVGYHPEVILAGRRINDGMGGYVVSRVVKLMIRNRIHVERAEVLVMGLTFKENCPDTRNTRVIDVIDEFRDYGASVDVYDPWVDAEQVSRHYGLHLVPELGTKKYDAVVVAVAHDEFRSLGIEKVRAVCKPRCVIYDVKNVFESGEADGRL